MANFTNLAGVGIVAALLTGAPALTQDVTDVEIVDSEGAEVVEGEAEFVGAWDIDGDGVILREEFENGLRGFGTFAAFDADSDGNVTEEEFTQGIFARYDADATGIIEEPELGDIGDDMGDEGFWDV